MNWDLGRGSLCHLLGNGGTITTDRIGVVRHAVRHRMRYRRASHASQRNNRVMRDRTIWPICGHTKPRCEFLKIGDREGFALTQAIEECAAADNDRCNSRQRFATSAGHFGVVPISDRSQCVLVCVVHTAICVVYDVLVNVVIAARDALRGRA